MVCDDFCRGAVLFICATGNGVTNLLPDRRWLQDDAWLYCDLESILYMEGLGY